MNKKLTKHGNSLALIIDKPILELLNFNDKTVLELSVQGGQLIVKAKAPQRRTDNLDVVAKNIMKKYDTLFKKLAKT